MTEGYGIAKDAPDTSWDDAARQLEASRNYWICTTRADGRPHAMPVWGLWLDGMVVFSSDPKSMKGRNIARDPEIVIHLESGDDVVVLEGRVEVLSGAAVPAGFSSEYEKKYGIAVDTSDPNYGVYVLRPRVALTWTEKDFQNTATRWTFK